MISENEKMVLVRMFCAYCRRTLRNVRTDILREEMRMSRRETLFSDMRESDLNQLVAPCGFLCEETVFTVLGHEIAVLGAELSDAIGSLSKDERDVILLYYFAGWTDRRIAETIGCPRSTIQFRRAKALLALRAHFGEEAKLDDYL